MKSKGANRFEGRHFDSIRPCRMTEQTFGYADGSVLIEFGQTKVLCNATILESVPRFLKDKGQGWLTAEYAMLPTATHTRSDRESVKGKQQKRSIEIQRIIGRALRQSLDLKKFGERTIHIDCDVLQADGGTRIAAINGSMVAIILALRKLQYDKVLTKDPLLTIVTAISIGWDGHQLLLDLDYQEDSRVDVDFNLIVDEQDRMIEIQGTAEHHPISMTQVNEMISLGLKGIQAVRDIQRKFLKIS